MRVATTLIIKDTDFHFILPSTDVYSYVPFFICPILPWSMICFTYHTPGLI